jgi:iron-sulfur cluster assembly protein
VNGLGFSFFASTACAIFVSKAMLQSLPVKITKAALAEIKHIVERKNIPSEYGLRIGMKGSGCAGTSFVIGFDKQKDQDQVFDLEGQPVFIEKKHLMYLFDVEVDFVENEVERGFVFNN